jgi:hypothetical protein
MYEHYLSIFNPLSGKKTIFALNITSWKTIYRLQLMMGKHSQLKQTRGK